MLLNLTEMIYLKNIAAALCCLSLSSNLYAQDFSKLYKKCLPAVVKLTVTSASNPGAEGTGFFVNEKTIVTCYHVIDDATSLKIESANGDQYTIDSILMSNQKADLVKFTIKEKSKSWLKLNADPPIVGEVVFTIGNPIDYDFSITSGIISGIRSNKSFTIIQTNASCSSGNSGGPLMNAKGEVIGVMSYVKFIGQNLNFAVSSNELLNLVNDKKITRIEPELQSINKEKLDSIIHLAEFQYSQKEYEKALLTITPVIKFVDSVDAVKITSLIGDCHFFRGEYLKAMSYYERLHKLIYAAKLHNDVYLLAETYQKLAICYFTNGDMKTAMDLVEQVISICKSGIQNDPAKSDVYSLLIQQAYVLNATHNFAVNNKEKGCLSWRLAKEYGYEKDEFQFDDLCK